MVEIKLTLNTPFKHWKNKKKQKKGSKKALKSETNTAWSLLPSLAWTISLSPISLSRQWFGFAVNLSRRRTLSRCLSIPSISLCLANSAEFDTTYFNGCSPLSRCLPLPLSPVCLSLSSCVVCCWRMSPSSCPGALSSTGSTINPSCIACPLGN